MNSPTLDYPYLRAWDQMMGSSLTWTRMQLANARADNAPNDAIYERSQSGGGRTHQWETYRDITNIDTKAVMNRILLGLQS